MNRNIDNCCGRPPSSGETRATGSPRRALLLGPPKKGGW